MPSLENTVNLWWPVFFYVTVVRADNLPLHLNRVQGSPITAIVGRLMTYFNHANWKRVAYLFIYYHVWISCHGRRIILLAVPLPTAKFTIFSSCVPCPIMLHVSLPRIAVMIARRWKYSYDNCSWAIVTIRRDTCYNSKRALLALREQPPDWIKVWQSSSGKVS